MAVAGSQHELVVEVDYETFYRDNYRKVVRLGLALTGSLGAAEDLAQDAFLAAHRKWDKLVNYDDPGAWVRRVVANKAVSRRRRKSSEQGAMTRLRNRRHSPVENPDHDHELWAAVRSLPSRQAQVIALVFVDGCTVPQTAATLDIGIETARTHLKRAKAALAAALGERVSTQETDHTQEHDTQEHDDSPESVHQHGRFGTYAAPDAQDGNTP